MNFINTLNETNTAYCEGIVNEAHDHSWLTTEKYIAGTH